MVTSALKLYAFPLALLMLSAGIAAPKAVAESFRPGRIVEARFVYKPSAPAEQTYANFRATAERACNSPGPRSFSLRKLDQLCVKDLLKQVLAPVSRTDLTEIHANKAHG